MREHNINNKKINIVETRLGSGAALLAVALGLSTVGSTEALSLNIINHFIHIVFIYIY